ncbi:MFS transporter [Corynebacterium ulceribovis]|uniref:MFS transporter n=1 Tax=Corynebacterium ulceribovis TaxID=487732 RepID=UPI000366784F
MTNVTTRRNATVATPTAGAPAAGATDTELAGGKKPGMGRVAVASLVGTTIEFYDFFIYGTAAALVFPALFFPEMTPALAVVASFATFGVAFLARPLGAIFFGHFGDSIGRKKTLVWTLLIMGIATILIGVLPGANTGVFGLFESGIGVLAPISLVVLRFLQGLAIGGEWAGATLLTAEYAPEGKRGFYGMFPQVGAAIAFFLSSGTFLVTGLVLGDKSDAFMDYGWRIPFLLSIVMVVVGLYVRTAISETPAFQKQKEREAAARNTIAEEKVRLPFAATFKEQWREVVIGGIACSAIFSMFYMGTSYLTAYGTKILEHSRTEVLAMGMTASVIFGAVIMGAAILSDRIGRRNVMLMSTIGTLLLSPVIFMIMDQGSLLAFGAGLTLTLVIFAMSYGPAGALLPEMFSTKNRYTGAGMAYNLAAIIGGAVPPLLAPQIAAEYGGVGVGLMMSVVGLIATCGALLLKKKTHTASIDATA